MFEPAVPLAKPQCQTERSGGYGSFAENCRVFNCWQSQETFYGWLHLCMMLFDYYMSMHLARVTNLLVLNLI